MNNDLISREALRKAFENLASDDYNEPIWYQQTVFETIDNAPTAELTCISDIPDDKVKDLQELAIDYSEGIAVFERKRPQGEWVTKGYEPYGRCNICGEICEINNFCGYCGADMREGGVE